MWMVPPEASAGSSSDNDVAKLDEVTHATTQMHLVFLLSLADLEDGGLCPVVPAIPCVGDEYRRAS